MPRKIESVEYACLEFYHKYSKVKRGKMNPNQVLATIWTILGWDETVEDLIETMPSAEAVMRELRRARE